MRNTVFLAVDTCAIHHILRSGSQSDAETSEFRFQESFEFMLYDPSFRNFLFGPTLRYFCIIFHKKNNSTDKKNFFFRYLKHFWITSVGQILPTTLESVKNILDAVGINPDKIVSK